MLLTYVDESATRTRYWMGALLCPEHTLISLTRALDEVVDKAADEFNGVSAQAELHGYSLLHGEDDWEALKFLTRARIGVYGRALEAIGASDARIIIRGVNIPRLRTRYAAPDHPHDVTRTSGTTTAGTRDRTHKGPAVRGLWLAGFAPKGSSCIPPYRVRVTMSPTSRTGRRDLRGRAG